ncbi:FRE8 [Candida oxycetoniae]|uniref:FRE8 n=1 Tax=Candida oxycetoniae TaxID=497107 RepID=A0AAI9WW13_9ASCO|nr:FRE8 [Candida oxycetoniae]KAI3402706.1 FRE8 [Candida oxycetoniae]
MNSTVQLWRDYFHFPSGVDKTKEYSELRNYITDKYGVVTTLSLLLFIVSIPAYQYFIVHNYRLKFHYLRSFYSKLNHYILHKHHLDHTPLTWKDRLFTNTSVIIKALAFKIFLHFSTIVQIVFWTCFLGTLSLVDIYNGDLIFLAKRLGRVAANCLPTILFLTIRPSPLPNLLYLSLLPIHKWLSRFVIVQSIIHTLIYLAYFNRNNTWKKAWKPVNIYGWVALVGFLTIIVTSLSPFRRRWYKVFYFMHYTWTWIIVGCMQIHVRPKPFTLYTITNCCILLGQIYYRTRLTRGSLSGEVKVIDVSPNLSLVEFPNRLIAERATAPGAHIRLTDYSSNVIRRVWKQVIPNYHPYSLVSLPNDSYQRLIIRKSNFRLYDKYRYLITGSYDPHLLFIKYKAGRNTTTNNQKPWSLSKLHLDAKRILIVIGGSAISFALPILRVMNYHGIPTKVVWVIKDFRDVLVLKYFDGFIHGDDFEIFVTGSDAVSNKSSTLLKGNDPNTNYTCMSKLSKKSIGSLSAHYDLENEEETPLLASSNAQMTSLNQENQVENIDIEINSEDEDEESECAHECAPLNILDDDAPTGELDALDFSSSNDNDDNDDNEDQHMYDEYEITNDTINLSDTHEGNISRKPSTNEPFFPMYTQASSERDKSWIQQFQRLTRNLNIAKRIYKGRPKMNNRYYNWCINEGFTQCSGPVVDEHQNLVCCQDLPRHRVVEEDINAEKIWVIAAGPKPLVENVKLWSSENGLKFHEEAFYS